MSVMTMLLAAEALGLGALFFGVFRGERQLRKALAIPPVMQLLGAIAIGWPAAVRPIRPVAPTTPGPAGRGARHLAAAARRTRSSTAGAWRVQTG